MRSQSVRTRRSWICGSCWIVAWELDPRAKYSPPVTLPFRLQPTTDDLGRPGSGSQRGYVSQSCCWSWNGRSRLASWGMSTTALLRPDRLGLSFAKPPVPSGEEPQDCSALFLLETANRSRDHSQSKMEAQQRNAGDFVAWNSKSASDSPQ